VVGGTHVRKRRFVYRTEWELGRMLNPWCAPRRSLKGLGEVLSLVDDFFIPEFHNTHCLERFAFTFVVDGVLRYPQLPRSHHAANLEAAGLSWMMSPQRLQVAAATNPLARLWIYADHVLVVNVVLCYHVPRGGCGPVLLQ
jgi:hypothetical protein